jgi:uncharacterized membrane protein YccC
MKQPSDQFIGTMLGLLIVLLAPSDYMHSEEDLWCWLLFFPVLGAIIGTIVGIVRRRKA